MLKYGVVVSVAAEGPIQLEYCLSNLRASAPESPVKVISDGVNYPVYSALCEQYGAQYAMGRYLRRAECGGQWWKRVLSAGMALAQPWFLRIDPDTRFWRPLRSMVPHQVAGSILNQGELAERISGGCVAFSREAAERILKSEILDSPELQEIWPFCDDKQEIHLWYPLGYLGLDEILVYVLRCLEIPFGPWHEIGSRAKVAPPNQGFPFAVTHPHKVWGGPDVSLPGDTPIRVITTCMSRLDHLKQTLPRWLEQTKVQVLVVDWSCPHGTADWVRSLNDPRAQVITVPGKEKFNLAAARNAGALHAAQDLPGGHAERTNEIWAFLDADVLVEPSWSSEVRRTFRDNHYHVAAPLKSHMGGSVILHPASYFAAGGYDETLQGWGCDDTLFYLMLRHFGVRAGTFPGETASTIKHNDHKRTLHYDIKDRWVSNRIFDHYYRLKLQYMQRTGYLPSPEECCGLLKEAESRDYSPGSAFGNGRLKARMAGALPHVP